MKISGTLPTLVRHRNLPWNSVLIRLFLLLGPCFGTAQVTMPLKPLIVRKTADFTIDGKDSDNAWEAADWIALHKLDPGGTDYASQFKILYSQTGIYLLFQGSDRIITTKDYKDMDRIWNGDVFEAFFHPDPRNPVYFEYEVNPLGRQLLLTISDTKNGMSWIPFNEYGKNDYGTYTKTSGTGGPLKVGKEIDSWTAEVFISYKSLGLLPGIPPASGSIWKANFCRLDHDSGTMIKWSWSKSIEKSLHELHNFRTIEFE